MTSYINIKKLKRLALVLGNQLFPIDQQNIDKSTTIFMCEDHGLCTYEKHHKSKIALFYMAMRSYRAKPPAWSPRDGTMDLSAQNLSGQSKAGAPVQECARRWLVRARQ